MKVEVRELEYWAPLLFSYMRDEKKCEIANYCLSSVLFTQFLSH